MTASIRLDSNPSPQEYAVGDTVALSNFSNAGVLGWDWTIIDKPMGSSAALVGSTTSTPSLVVDVEGTYIVRLRTYVDSGRTVLDDSDRCAVVVKFDAPYDWRVPAATETTEVDGTRGWAPAPERVIRDIHAFMVSGFTAVVGAHDEETTTVGSEVVMGGFYFNGGNLPPLGAKLRLIGKLDSSTPGAELTLRLYDMGEPGTPIAPVLRSEAIITTQGAVDMAEVDLSPVAAPGVNADEIHNVARLYELRLILDGATPGDAGKLHWAGIAIV